MGGDGPVWSMRRCFGQIAFGEVVIAEVEAHAGPGGDAIHFCWGRTEKPEIGAHCHLEVRNYLNYGISKILPMKLVSRTPIGQLILIGDIPPQ